MASEHNEKPSESVQTAAVTTITISPNISGSGVAYTVYGKSGSGSGSLVSTGSALNGPVTVTVSGYDQYFVSFGSESCTFGNSVAIRSGLTADVTLAITTTQG
ncbi:MAG: hypothetical protein ABIS20_18830 [Thermoanaerobaculia bacterium]